MLHDFAVALATFITIMGSVLAQDAQQLSTTVGNFLHPAATSVNYASTAQTQPAAAATLNPDPFHTADTQPASWPQSATSPPVTAAALPKSPATLVEPKSSTLPAPVLQGKVLGASTAGPITMPQLTAITTVFVGALHDLETRLTAKFASGPTTAFIPPQVAAGGTTVIYQSAAPASQRIDNLANTTITNPAISGGTITGASISGGSITATDFSGTLGVSKGGTGTSSAPTYGMVLLGNAAGDYDLTATSSLGIVSGGTPGGSNTQVQFNDSGSFGASALLTFNKTTGELDTNGLVATNATTTNATSTSLFATLSHFTAGIIDTLTSTIGNLGTITTSNATFTNSTTTNATSTNFAATNASTTKLTTGSLTLGSATGVLYAAGGPVSAIANGADGLVLKLSGGVPTWGTDQTGSGGGSSIWATTTDSLAAYLSPASTMLLVGSSATTTTGNIFEVKGNSLFRGTATAYNTITAPSFTATSSTASQLPYASTTAITATTASTSALIISRAPGGLLKTSAAGVVSVATAGSDYLNSTSGDWSGTLGGFSAAQLIAAGFSTTSADAFAAQRNFFSTTSADAFVAQRNFFSTTSTQYLFTLTNFFSTTSTDFWKTQTNFFSTTSADAFAAQRNFFSTTSSSWFLSQNQGAAFSTTSADAFLSQRNLFSTTSSDFFASQRSFFSTTSANFWKSVTDLFSTTSSNYLLSTYDKGFFFSTTSADAFAGQRNFFSSTSASYFLSQNGSAAFSTTSATYFTDASSSIAKTYTNNTFTGTQTLANASTTNISSTYASSTSGYFGNLSIASLTGFLKATAGVISSALVDLAANVTGILPVGNGGTGWANVAAGAVIYGNGSSAISTTTVGLPGQTLALLNGVPTWTATTTFSTGLAYSNGTVTLDTSGNWTGTHGGYTAAQLIAAGFSTTSADAFIVQRNFFSTTSTNYWKSVTDLFSTTSSNYLLSTYDKGFFFSTTSADAFASQRNFFSTTSADAFVVQRNFFSTTSTDFWKTANSFFSTTSANYWASGANFFSTTSADYFASQRNFFATTSASYFADASTSIPKTYTTNSFTATQTFTNASTTNISSSYASSTSGFFGSLSVGSLSGFVKAIAGVLTTALVDLASNVTGILAVGNGGTGWASLAAGAVPYGNGDSAIATTTVGLPGQVLALLNGVPAWTSTTTFSGGLAFSNGTVSLNSSFDKGFFFSTTSADAFAAQRNFFSTTSADAFVAQRNFFSTTSTDFWKTQNSFFSTTSASYFLAQNTGASFSSTSAIYFTDASTTIPKAYSSNTFSGSNIFSGSLTFGSLSGPLDARAGVVGATTSIGVLYGGTGATTLTGLLQGNGTSAITAVTGTAGQFPYFNGASTLNATSSIFLATSGNVGIGTTTPWQLLSVNGTVATNAILPNGPCTKNLSAFDLGATSQRWNALWAGTLNIGTSTFSLKSDSASNLGFYTAASGGGTQAMTITSSGNVGIGTTSPAYKLDVSGTIGTGAAGTDGKVGFKRTSDGVELAGVGVDGGNSWLYLNSGGSNGTVFQMSGTEVARITNAGNVGIGTTSPSGKLAIRQDSSASIPNLYLGQDLGTWNSFALFQSYRFIHTGSGATDGNFREFNVGAGGVSIGYTTTPAYGSNDALYVNGNVGIGTTTPGKALEVDTGTDKQLRLRQSGTAYGKYWDVGADGGNSFIIFNQGGAGVYMGDGGTSWQSTSDKRLKTNITPLASSTLDEILALNPVTFNWKDTAQNALVGQQIGFIAQQVQQVFPGLVSTIGTTTILNADGSTTTVANTLGLNYTGLISPIIAALQDIANITGTFKTNLLAWLGSASNGIDKLFANEIVATNISADTITASSSLSAPLGNFEKLCLGARCMTAEQFNHILDMEAAAGNAPGAGNQGAAGGSSTQELTGADTTSTTMPASLKVNGNNPAQWPLNQIWNDNLGALFTHNGQNETIYSTSTVDVTAPGTSTIDYWAQVPGAQSLHTTRTVVIKGVANDNQATSTPPAANDNPPPLDATGTNATTTP
jgi:endosialidase-like protein